MATDLIAASSRGDTATVERLLLEGVDPNARNEHGRTALHEAAANAHAETAACLLVYGADHTLADGMGKRPLALDHISIEALHDIRQRYRRFRPQRALPIPPISAQVEEWALELEQNGILKISGLISPDELARMREEFEAFIRNLQSKVQWGDGIYKHYDEEEHVWEKDRAFVCNNAFKYSPQFVKLCCREELSGLANRYLARPAFVTRGVAMRYWPSKPTDNDMFGWHHDIEDSRLKVMILLTDVTSEGMAMTYVLRSHKMYHPYKMFFENTSSLDYCQQHMSEIEIFTAKGQAGDLFLFDSNGTHRGNRKETASIRDVFLVEYTTEKSDVWGGDINPQAFEGIDFRGHNPFEFMTRVVKKWKKPKTRKEPTWIENLPHVERWL